jgi:hypothetical protein
MSHGGTMPVAPVGYVILLPPGANIAERWGLCPTLLFGSDAPCFRKIGRFHIKDPTRSRGRPSRLASAPNGFGSSGHSN